MTPVPSHPGYVHGYSEREETRLLDQASTLTSLLHHDTTYPPGSRVLEAGCGVGAQTVTLARQSPGARITSLDISPDSLATAARRVAETGLSNVEFLHGDIFALPFADEAFDHVFVCFVLEHLADPRTALDGLRRVLRPGGTLTVIEGDHGSAYFHPDSPVARRAIDCLVELQARGGGDANIGRRLYPLLTDAGWREVRVSPRMVYADASRPEMVTGFTRDTFNAMVEGVREDALAAGLVDGEAWERGLADLHRTEQSDGVFCYTFFKAVALR